MNPNGQDAHRLVQAPSHPDRMWIQHHNGIFRSDDAGKVWHAMLPAEPSSFGFAVAVHPKDGDTAWFVPEIKDEKRIPAGGTVRGDEDARRRQDVRGALQGFAARTRLRHRLPPRHGCVVQRLRSGDWLDHGGSGPPSDQGDTWDSSERTPSAGLCGQVAGDVIGSPLNHALRVRGARGTRTQRVSGRSKDTPCSPAHATAKRLAGRSTACLYFVTACNCTLCLALRRAVDL